MYIKLSGKLISICGLDGVGKTTQITILKRLLEIQGYKVDIVWIRVLHLFSYITYCLLKDKLEIILKNKYVKLAWLWFEVYNITLKMMLFYAKKFFRKCLGRDEHYVYLAERYLLDSIVSIIAFFVKDIKFILKIPLKFLILRMLKEVKHGKAIFIFLDLNAEDIIKRRMKRDSIFDKHLRDKCMRLKALQHTRFQNVMYRIFVKYVNGFVLDASQPKSEIARRIYEIIVRSDAIRQS